MDERKRKAIHAVFWMKKNIKMYRDTQAFSTIEAKEDLTQFQVQESANQLRGIL